MPRRRSSPIVSIDRPRLRRALLAWYRASARDLPWRRTRDPYAIWISETMLQQTTVQTVIPYYERFLAQVPDLRSLARSREDDLLALWSGLGYYRRVRNLRAAARQIVERHGGRFPSRLEEILALPGVGRYTAGAVASIAFDARTPVVDGNVARVLTRLFALPPGPARARLWRLADELAPARNVGEWNQALMELGATVCRPAAPLCAECPAAPSCLALARGDAAGHTLSRTRPRPIDVRAALVAVERAGRVLLVRRPERELLGGLWELPGTLADALRDSSLRSPSPALPAGKPPLRHSTEPHGGRTGGPAQRRAGSDPGMRAAYGGAQVMPARGGAGSLPSSGASPRMAARAAAEPTVDRPAGARDGAGPAPIDEAMLARTLRHALGFEPEGLESCGEVRHSVTHRRLRIAAWRADAPARLPSALDAGAGDAHLWADPERIGAIPIGSASRKVLAAVRRRPSALL